MNLADLLQGGTLIAEVPILARRQDQRDRDSDK